MCAKKFNFELAPASEQGKSYIDISIYQISVLAH